MIWAVMIILLAEIGLAVIVIFCACAGSMSRDTAYSCNEWTNEFTSIIKIYKLLN